MMIRATFEVVAEDRDDLADTLRSALGAWRRGKIVSGKTVNFCIGDYRVTFTEEVEEEAPFVNGDRVMYVGEGQGITFKGTKGTVLHSGPGSTGVLWDNYPHPIIRSNKDCPMVKLPAENAESIPIPDEPSP